MGSGPSGVALRHLHTLLTLGTLGDQTDRQLIERFVAREGDAAEAAFATLVDRHGPMVLGVCRRILSDPHDIQDAFQATFLVLVKKAGSVRVDDSLGRWLYGVSVRVAQRSRAVSARQRTREQPIPAGLSVAPSRDADRCDLRAVLDEELVRLPATHRAALVLCYLEGHTHEQAARRLGWPVGTVRSRLARGRERLRVRLLRRGCAPSAGLLGSVLPGDVATAAVPLALAESTVRVAILSSAGKAAMAGAFPVSVVALSETIIRTMLMTKLRMATTALLTLSVVAVGAGGFAWQTPEARKQREVPHAEGEGVVNTVGPDASDREKIQGTWRAVSALYGGRNPPEDEVKGLELVITSDTVTIRVGNRILVKATYKLDPKKDPKWIDLLDVIEGLGRLTRGIYDLQGDDLRFCYDESSNVRPTRFSSERNSRNDVLLILKRQRPEATQTQHNGPAGGSNAHRKSVVLAKEAFGERHWSAAEDIQVRYHNASEGYWMYAKEYERLNDGKRLRLKPFALIWVGRPGEGLKTATSEEAVIDLDKPIGLANDSGDSLPDIVNAQMLGDVHLRDDKATPENTDDDLLIDPVSHVEYDGKSLRIQGNSHVRIRAGNSTLSGRDLRIVLPQPGARPGKK